MSIFSRQYGQGLRRPPPGGPFLSRLRRSRVGVPPRCFATSAPAASYSGSERDVVVRCPRRGRRLLEVAGVGRDVTLRREATAVLAAITRPEELDGVGNDIDGLPLVASLVLPLAPLEPAVDRDGSPLLEI